MYPVRTKELVDNDIVGDVGDPLLPGEDAEEVVQDVAEVVHEGGGRGSS